MNILQAVQVIGALTFAPTNFVGPQMTLSLPKVLLITNKEFDLISDEWGMLELQGMVLGDPTTGSFGTWTVTGDQPTPNIANNYVGKGKVSFNGAFLGNAPKFSFNPKPTPLKHYSHILGRKFMDNAIIQVVEAEIAITLDEINTANLELAMLGQ